MNLVNGFIFLSLKSTKNLFQMSFYANLFLLYFMPYHNTLLCTIIPSVTIHLLQIFLHQIELLLGGE